jgi:hypothetical protein
MTEHQPTTQPADRSSSPDRRLRVGAWIAAAARVAGLAVAGLAVAGLAVAGAACGSSAPPPPAAPRGPTACARASDSVVAVMLARYAAKDAPTEAADALRNLIRERCKRDGWSAEATRCLIAMTRLEDGEACSQFMTADQQAALVRDQEAQSGPRGPSAPVVPEPRPD